MGALEVLNEESEPLGLRVTWVKTNIQAFNGILDAAILSVPDSGEDVEVMERVTYLGSDILVSACFESEVDRRLSRAWGLGSHGFTGSEGVVLSVSLQDDENPSL